MQEEVHSQEGIGGSVCKWGKGVSSSTMPVLYTTVKHFIFQATRNKKFPCGNVAHEITACSIPGFKQEAMAAKPTILFAIYM